MTLAEIIDSAPAHTFSANGIVQRIKKMVRMSGLPYMAGLSPVSRLRCQSRYVKRQIAEGESMHKGVVEKLMEVFGSKDFERTIPEMYVDVKGLVTVGIGFLINTPTEARKLTFRLIKPPKRLAAHSEIDAEWKRAHVLGPGRNRRVPHPTMILTQKEIEKEFRKRARQAKSILKNRFSAYFGKLDTWPADAQLGLLAMAWSGPGLIAGFPKFRAACAAKKFDDAARESHMKVRPQYNKFFAHCFNNADYVQHTGKPITTLLYPTIGIWKKNAKTPLKGD